MRHIGRDSGPQGQGVIPGGLMNTQNDGILRHKLTQLKQQHRDLDETVTALEAAQQRDVLTLSRLKKRKLSIRDEIARIEDQLLPDIIA